MEGGVDADLLLEFVEFQIFLSEGRYEAHIGHGNTVEAVSSGLLKQLVLHSPKIKSLHSKGSDAIFNFKPPGNLTDAKWFTKSTLIRFLRIISSSDIINVAKAIVNEILQLEDVRKFHVSLYSKADDNPTSSDASKNELLRAMDLRLTALTEELAALFDKAVGTKCSFEDITDVEKFSYYFGAVDLRNLLQKFLGLRQNTTGDFPSKQLSLPKNNVWNDKAGPEEGNSQKSRPSKSNTAVKYSASPAKAAQIERENSSASEESSSTSEEEQPSMERSRYLMRCASPRRSASPMRRVRIGRSGSRRSAALTIKSLNFIPARERSFFENDESASNSNEEECEQTSRKSENNVKRMSVQDAISLFESKQKVPTVDFQKTRSLLSVTVGANKAVLRRWSSGVYENSNSVNVASADPASPATNNLEDQEIESASEMKPESNPTPKSYNEAADNDCKPNIHEERASSPECMRKESHPNQGETSEKLNASVEWTRKKEEELNQLLMKMMETKPTKYQNSAPSDRKLQRISNERRRGGFYDHYKEKREEKFRGETTRKQAEKQKQFKALQRLLDERKAEMVSRNVSIDNKNPTIKRTQKVVKNSSESANSRSGTPKLADVKEVPSKTSRLPATRKSWPSVPSPRATGISPAKGPAGTTPTRRISQPAPATPQSSQKVERLQPKTVRATQNDARKSVKIRNETRLESVTKTSKPRRSQPHPASEDSASSAKPKLSKLTKKSSVVPLESKEPKPFLRKGSGTGYCPSFGLSPAINVKVSSQPKECVTESVDLVQMEKKEMACISPNPVNQVQDRSLEDLKVHEDENSFEAQAKSTQKCENIESFNKVTPNDTNHFVRIEESTLTTNVEGESNISPNAWVEIEEHADQSRPSNSDFSNNESLVDVAYARVSSPRVRHSLSQMLLEDNSESDVIEWGIAENPPTMVNQKDVPKGLKRLLKFARKSKTDASSTGFSCPSVFSEGEDDPEDSKILTKRSSDNLLKKATLHAKIAGQHKSSSSEFSELSAPTSIGKIAAQKLQESHISASLTTTKATRSFFSLSAFKGSKQNDAKLR